MLHAEMTEYLEADLYKIAPVRNEYRFYRLAIWPDLFGGWSLAREYGRLGQPGTLRLSPYQSRDDAITALRRLLRQKQRRGYRRFDCGNA